MSTDRITELAESVIDCAVHNLESTGTLQASVRELIAEARDATYSYEEQAAVVARCVSAFRNRAQVNLDDLRDTGREEEMESERKRINNIVNDISRITRELTNYSVVCTSRKGGYIYSTKEVKPTVTGTAEPEPDTDDEDSLQREAIYSMYKKEPQNLLRALVNKYGSEDIGRMAVEVIREARDTGTSDS